MTQRSARSDAVEQHVRERLAEPWAALVAGFGKSAVRTARRRGQITAVLPGYYAAAEPADLFRVRARALTLLSAPNGVVTGLAAGHLWGIVDRAPRRITIQVATGWHLGLPAWARPLRVGICDVRFRLSGILVAPVADAVVQVWREAAPDVAASTMIKAVADGHTTLRDVREAVARRKRLPRRAELEELLGLIGAKVTSYLEYVAWKKVFPPRLFPGLEWQKEVWPRGRRRVMDAFDAEARIDLEFDGGGTHGGADGFERDRERDADMRSLGIEPLHFTYRDLTERPEWCRAQYLALRVARLAALGHHPQ